MEEKQVGKITHFFGKIGVGVIELTDELKAGDTIRIAGGDRDFTQEAASMQIEHQSVEKAGAGEAIGIKLEQPAKEGDAVYKVIE